VWPFYLSACDSSQRPDRFLRRSWPIPSSLLTSPLPWRSALRFGGPTLICCPRPPAACGKRRSAQQCLASVTNIRGWRQRGSGGSVLAETAHGRGGTICERACRSHCGCAASMRGDPTNAGATGTIDRRRIGTFIRLAHNVEREMERRRGHERRREVRSSADRRSGRTQDAEELAFRLHPSLPRLRNG
jgi:hypothetical protein